MKAVIVEIRGETAAALGRDGSVFKVKNRSYAVGQTIDVRRGGLSRQLAVLAAAAAAVFLIVGAGIHTYLSPYSLVSLDVNPSLQYTLNRLGLVLSVEAVNGDGDELLQEVGALNNRSIEDAITITVKQIAEDGYFDGEEPGGMVIAASSHDEQEAARLAENVKETAIRATQESEKKVVVAAVTVAEEKVQAAKELGVSPGKLTLVEQLKETASDPETIDVQEWLEKPVKDIMKETVSQTPESSAPSSSGSESAVSDGEASLPEAPADSSAQASSESAQSANGSSGQTAPSSGTVVSSEAPLSQIPLGPPPQSKPSPKPDNSSAGSGETGGSSAGGSESTGSSAESEASGGMESGSGSENSGGPGSKVSGSGSSVSSEGGESMGTGSSQGGSESSGSASSSTSHEAPESGVSSGTPLGPTDGWEPPAVASSESSASSRKTSSKDSRGDPLPYAPDPNVSLPWWETMF